MQEIEIKKSGLKGEFQEIWLQTKLGEACEKILVGIATEVRPYVREFGVPIVRNQNIREDFFDDSEMIFISEEFDQSNKNKRIKTGDILIVRTGSNVGQACVVPPKYNLAQTFTTLIIRVGSKIDSKFLSLHINSFGIKEVERLSVGGGKPNLNAGFLKEYQILLPPLPEQRAIADCLSTWDGAIRATEQLIAQKELQKKWLMQQLLTGKKRLKGFSGEWRDRKLGEFLVESRIPSEDSSPDQRITVKLSLNGVEKREVRGTESKDSTLYFIRKAGQFIYGKQNLHKGAFGIIPEELNGFESSQDLPAFDFKDNVNDQYFLLFISQVWFYKSLENIASGTGSKRIHPKSLFKVRVPWPKLEEQQAIATILSESDRELGLLRDRLVKLQEQKKGMMQVLLTGKRRLRIEN